MLLETCLTGLKISLICITNGHQKFNDLRSLCINIAVYVNIGTHSVKIDLHNRAYFVFIHLNLHPQIFLFTGQKLPLGFSSFFAWVHMEFFSLRLCKQFTHPDTSHSALQTEGISQREREFLAHVVVVVIYNRDGASDDDYMLL